MLNKKDLRELIETTRLNINLPAAVIEKDYYVTQTIHALSSIENEYFRLVFCGGTCLAKAHKIVNRMSEDIDFKIQIKNNQIFSRSRLIKELKEFRRKINDSLRISDLTVSENVARNEGKYQIVTLKYPSSFSVNSILRPELLLEFTFADIRLPVTDISVNTIIENVLMKVKIFTPPQTSCISIDETAIEKWVGLTRRVVAIERNYHSDDKTLVRHIYDLSSIKLADKINTNFFTLTKEIIRNDAKQFKNQHQEYSADPIAEIKESLSLLKNKPIWKEHYLHFIGNLVYDPTTALEYEKAIGIIESISARVIDNL